MEGWWVRELELHLDSVPLRSSAFSITPAMLLKITGGKGFIIRQIWVGPFLLTLINATKLGRLLTLSLRFNFLIFWSWHFHIVLL